MSRILLIDQSENAATLLRRSFADVPIEIDVVTCVREVLKPTVLEGLGRYDMILLDLSLPDGDGIQLLEIFRQRIGDNMPVFVWADAPNLETKILCFNLGADDFFPREISGLELKARIQRKLKKMALRSDSAHILTKGAIRLDLSLLSASLLRGSQTKALHLTAKEFKILALLLKNEGHVFARSELVRAVWGDSVHVVERTVDSHIFGLRKKLGTSGTLIECIPHAGYRFTLAEKFA